EPSGGPPPDKPVTRVADGDVALPWADTTATGPRYLFLDLGSGVQLSAAASAVARGHHLTGVPCTGEVATTLSGPWTTVGSITPASTAAFRVAFSAIPSRCWRFTMTAPN